MKKTSKTAKKVQKTATKTVSKLDPKEVFIISSMTRAKIAEELNGTIENENLEIPKFTENDPRLTSELCQDLMYGLEDSRDQIDEITETDYEVWRNAVEDFAGK